MAVVLAATNGDKGSSQQRSEAEQGAAEVAAAVRVAENAKLACEEDAEEAEAGEGEGGVARGEGAPAVVEGVVVCFGADGDGDEGVGRGVGRGFAAGEEVGAGAADSVFHEVGDEGG